MNPTIPIVLAGLGLLYYFRPVASERRKMNRQQVILFDHLEKVEVDPAKVGAGAATFNQDGFPASARVLAERAKRMAAGK